MLSFRAWDCLLRDVTRAVSALEVCAGEEWGCVRLNGRGDMGIPWGERKRKRCWYGKGEEQHDPFADEMKE